jgi:hypothetical protein
MEGTIMTRPTGADDVKRVLRLAILALFAFLFAGFGPSAMAQGAVTAPSYVVVSSGLTAQQAAALGRALRVPIDGQIAGGAYQYVDPGRFFALPTVPVAPIPGSELNEDLETVTSEGIDFRSVRNFSPPSKKRALAMVSQALAAAGISLSGGTPRASNTYFDAFDLKGRRTLHNPIATNVTYEFLTPDGTPLDGPGAKGEFVFDPDGQATLVWLATRALARGPDVPILSHDEALAQCAIGAPPGASVTADLVHYAPPLFLDVSAIVPHYLCGGSAPTDAGATERLKERYIPATLPGGPMGPPSLTVSAVATGSALDAQADVIGGRPPYTVAWGSANTPIPAISNSSTISYDVTSRDPATSFETVTATVTDADGLTSSAGDSIVVSGVLVPADPVVNPFNRTVGIEYQAATAGLWGPGISSWELVKGVITAVPSVNVSFVEAELMSWETDFRTDLSPGGHDRLYADNVDLLYYNAHGFVGGFTFSSMHDFDYIEAATHLRLGDRDLEWLALDTCLVLNNSDGAVVPRVLGMFTGLHSVLGFDTTAEDTSELGGIFSDYLFGTSNNPYSHSLGAHLTLVQAWALATIITNHDDKAWAAMGPFGANGISDVNDRFWGFGAVGPDIRYPDIKGFWRLSGPC